MSRPVRIVARVVFAVSLLILTVAAVAPLIPAEGLSAPVGEALAEALERRVEITGDIRWRLFGGIGLRIGSVIIHDDPAIGLEPVAYVDSLDVGLRISSLWRGRPVFSYIRLVEPSVNLAKSAAGVWNFPPLLGRAFTGSARGSAPLPQLQVRDGRLNFRDGDTKSVFYFSNADVDIWPDEGAGQAAAFRFEGAPARTDRPAQSFGSFSGGGRLLFPAAGENRVELNLHMQRSAIAEVMTLLAGRSFGLEGFVASNARLEGPLSAIGIEGELRLAELDRRYPILGQAPEPLLPYRGRLDVSDQGLLLETLPGGDELLPLSIQLRASSYLMDPEWEMTVALRRMPLEALTPVAREMGIGPAEGVTWTGVVTGAVDWSSAAGLHGDLTVEEASVNVNGAGFGVSDAKLRLGDGRIDVPSATLLVDQEQTARAVISYETGEGTLRLALDTKELSLESQRAVWEVLTGETEPFPLRSFQGGTFAGRVECSRTGRQEAVWSGRITVEGSSIAIAGLSSPLSVESARVAFSPDGIQVTRLRGNIEGLALAGQYDFRANDPRPHYFDITFEQADATDVEALLLPTLERSRPGFIARTLRLRPSPPPEWLASRRAAGKLRVAELSAGSLRLTGVECDLYWDGAHLQLLNFRGTGGRTRLSGRLDIDLARPAPEYLVRAAVSGLRWQGGTLDAEGRLTTSGSGLSLIANAFAEGSFHARNVRSADGATWSQVSGCYEMSIDRALPRLTLPCLEIRQARRTYYGWGATTLTGGLNLELFSGEERLNASASLIPFTIKLGPNP